MIIPDRVTQRAYSHWTEDKNGCYISTYAPGSHGYAQIGWKDDYHNYGTTAHRAAWVHVHGQIEGRMDVDHRPECDRRCVNVLHLRLVTPSQNRRRNKTAFPIEWACKRGHDESERRKTTRGEWVCRACDREDSRKRYAESRAGLPPPVHWNARKTVCKRGHPLFVRPNGRGRWCPICHKESGRRWKKTHAKGGNWKLTIEQAAAIAADGRSARLVAADYGITHTTVYRIKKQGYPGLT